jgi:protein involved in polysaccharide export with SLBB domain
MEIISMAGGLTDDAFLKGSKIIRKIYPSVGEKEFARVKAMPAISLSELERSYLKTKLIEERGLVSMDFEKLFSNESNIYNIILRDKDEITIARKSLSIKVSGSVVSPGLISFKENKDYKYYINQAGGFNTRAKKRMVQIIKGGTEIVLEPNKVEKLEAGDAIWIPEKEYRDKVQITKDILTILSSIASVVTSTITVISFVQQQ